MKTDAMLKNSGISRGGSNCKYIEMNEICNLKIRINYFLYKNDQRRLTDKRHLRIIVYINTSAAKNTKHKDMP